VAGLEFAGEVVGQCRLGLGHVGEYAAEFLVRYGFSRFFVKFGSVAADLDQVMKEIGGFAHRGLLGNAGMD
jgi:hypothetical protein